MMTSGQMWNHIRAPPFMESDPRSGSAVSELVAVLTCLNKSYALI